MQKDYRYVKCRAYRLNCISKVHVFLLSGIQCAKIIISNSLLINIYIFLQFIDPKDAVRDIKRYDSISSDKCIRKGYIIFTS